MTEADDLELQPISAAAVPRAVAKAKHYRLLNEPAEAESICRDVLSAQPDNDQVMVVLLLALTDQFGVAPRWARGEGSCRPRRRTSRRVSA